MLNISKQGNSIYVDGVEHYLYPNNGVLTFPLNSVICVVDDSDIVTFRSASNYDILFSGLVTEIKIAGESVTKETVGEKFGAISNAASGGGGGEGGTTNYNDLTNKPKLNGQTLQGNVTVDIPTKTSDLTNDSGFLTEHQDISGKANVGDSYTKAESDAKYLTEHQSLAGLETSQHAQETYQPKGNYIETETDPVWNSEKVNYTQTSGFATINGQKITEGGDIVVGGGEGGTTNYNELSNKPTLNGQTLQGAVTIDIPSKTSDLTNDSGFLTEHQSLEGYATETWVEGKGYMTSYTETDPTVPSHVKGITEQDISNWNGKSTFSGNYDDLSNKPTIPSKTSDLTNDSGFLTEHQSLEGYATETWVEGKGYMTSYTETDPTVPSHVKAITEEDIAKWNEGGGESKADTVVGVNEAPQGNVGIAVFNGEGTPVEVDDPLNTGDMFYMRPLTVGETAQIGSVRSRVCIIWQSYAVEGDNYTFSVDSNWTIYNSDMEVVTSAKVGEALYAKYNGTASTLFKADIFTRVSDKKGVYVYDGTETPNKVLTSETDPTVPSHVKAITEADITNWNNKANLEDDYLFSYLDGIEDITTDDASKKWKVKNNILETSNSMNLTVHKTGVTSVEYEFMSYGDGNHYMVFKSWQSWTQTEDESLRIYNKEDDTLVENVVYCDFNNTYIKFDAGISVGHEKIAGTVFYINDLEDKLKTVNGNSLVGSGNIFIQTGITTETDPTVPSHVKAITEADIAKWNAGGGSKNYLYNKSVADLNNENGVITDLKTSKDVYLQIVDNKTITADEASKKYKADVEGKEGNDYVFEGSVGEDYYNCFVSISIGSGEYSVQIWGNSMGEDPIKAYDSATDEQLTSGTYNPNTTYFKFTAGTKCDSVSGDMKNIFYTNEEVVEDGTYVVEDGVASKVATKGYVDTIVGNINNALVALIG